jgi:hypothetical protein
MARHRAGADGHLEITAGELRGTVAGARDEASRPKVLHTVHQLCFKTQNSIIPVCNYSQPLNLRSIVLPSKLFKTQKA